MKLPLESEQVRRLIRLAIEEDVGAGDVTTDALAGAGERVSARVVPRAAGVVAGLPLIEPILREFAREVRVKLEAADGESVRAGQVLAVVDAPARALLSAERTVLNFLGRLSGVATLTRRFVEAVAGTGAKIYDTRKTTPGWRLLEKYAVRVGGGESHRIGLFDQALIKDNHLAVMKGRTESLRDAVCGIRRAHPGIVVEIEAATEADVRAAVEAAADIILLDNMDPGRLASAVKLVRSLAAKKPPALEASGGVNLRNVRAIAASGVERISVGALTHSAPALDVAIDVAHYCSLHGPKGHGGIPSPFGGGSG